MTLNGVVSDESGAVLPGVTVTLSGPYGTRSTTTGTQGEFRFLNLTPVVGEGNSGDHTHMLTVARVGGSAGACRRPRSSPSTGSTS